MAVSGTISNTTFDTQRIIDHAFRLCKLTAEQCSGEWQQTARDILYLFLSNLANQGAPLWCLEYQIIALYEGLAQVQLPTGTVDVRIANERRLTRLTGTYASSAGGTANNAFDDDFETRCTQTSAAGNISVDFGSDTQVTTVGLLPGSTGSLAMQFQRSSDQSAWTTIYTVSAATFTDRTWAWYDLDGNEADQFFRVNATTGTLDMREIFVGNNPAEIPLSRINIDQYYALSNRVFPGQPLQYFLDRTLQSTTGKDAPIMNTYPVTNTTARYDQITIRRHRYIMDVGDLTDVLEIPQRWYLAVVRGLALLIAEQHPNVSIELAGVLKIGAFESLQEAQSEERDDSPIFWAADSAQYTA